VRAYWIIDYSKCVLREPDDLRAPARTSTNRSPNCSPKFSPACYPDVPAQSCSSAACVAAYGRLAAAAAAHFRGRGVLWESINEPFVLLRHIPPMSKSNAL